MKLIKISLILCVLYTASHHAIAAPTSGTLRSEVTLGQPLTPSPANVEPDSKLDWYPAQELTLVGKGWDEGTSWSVRLPNSALPKVPEAVAKLATNSAGIALHFATDAKNISAVWDSVEAMNHMPRTGSGGLDLYERRGNDWVYSGTGIPREKRTLGKIGNTRSGELTEYLLYLPLYSPINELKLGVESGAQLMPVTDNRSDRLPVVFYGTSITQGGCASRSGMGHVTILGRWLDREVINLGFSGSGKGEPVMAELVAEIPASLYVIESLPNMSTELVTERIPGFVRTLREKHPDTPILLVQNPLKANDSEQNTALTKVYEDLKTAGINNLHLLPADGQLDGRENGTVDGVHPTDLGFLQMAECYFPVVEGLLEE